MRYVVQPAATHGILHDGKVLLPGDALTLPDDPEPGLQRWIGRARHNGVIAPAPPDAPETEPKAKPKAKAKGGAS